MTTATRNRRLYKIDKLEPHTRRLAMERFQERRNKTWDSFDTETVSEPMEYKLKEHYGITDCELTWSLSCCQGDGVAFKGKPDITKWAEKDEYLAGLISELESWSILSGFEPPEYSVGITIHGNYSHWNSMTVELVNETEWDGTEDVVVPLMDRVCDINDYLNKAVKDISRDLERIGYDEIDYQSSEEYLTDNDYRFTANGHRYKRK